MIKISIVNSCWCVIKVLSLRLKYVSDVLKGPDTSKLCEAMRKEPFTSVSYA